MYQQRIRLRSSSSFAERRSENSSIRDYFCLSSQSLRPFLSSSSLYKSIILNFSKVGYCESSHLPLKEDVDQIFHGEWKHSNNRTTHGAEGGDDFLLRAGLFVHTVGYDTRNKP